MSANGSTDGHVDIWTTDDARSARTHRGGQRVQGLGFDPSGDLLIASRVDQFVTVWDTRSGSVVQHMRIGGPVTLNPQSAEVAAVLDGDVKVWDLRTGAELRDLEQGDLWDNPCALTYSPDGSRLAGAPCARDGAAMVTVWTAESAQTDLQMSATWGPELQWSPDGVRLAVLLGRRRDDTYWEEFRLWDGNEFTTLMESGTTVGGFDWSPDSRMIASGMAGPDSERSVVLWDVESGAQSGVLPGRTNPVFSPDGAYLAVGIPGHGPELYGVPSPTPTATSTPRPGPAGARIYLPAASQRG
jgi:WD40 repeat protein